MKVRTRWLLIGGGGALLLLFLLVGLLRPKPAKSVQVATVARQSITSVVKAPATIEPKTVVNVSAELPGRIVQLAVAEGQHVKKGQLLLRLDSANYQEQVRQAQAMVASAEARLRGAQSNWDAARPNYERRKKLFEQKLLSPGEMETAEREHQAARSEFEATREEVSRSRAALRAARDQLSKTVYLSPLSGTVISLNVEEGEIVMIGTMNNPGTRILAVGDLDRMLAKAEVDETDVIDLRLGQKAKIEVDALPDTSFPARVTEIAHSATASGSSATGETDFEVKVLFDDHVPQVRPGMKADVSIETASKDSALTVPIQAVVVRSEEELKRAQRGAKGRRRGAEASDASTSGSAAGRKERAKDKTGVFVLVGDKVEFREVKTGIAGDTDIEVIGKIEPGTRVVTGPYQVLRDLKPGQRVRVEKATGRETRRG